MATITQRGPYQWQAKVRVQGQPTVSKTFVMRADAERWARRTQSEIERGTYIGGKVAERTTIATVAKSFTLDFAPEHYRGDAWRHKLNHILKKLGAYSLAALTPERVASYRDQRFKEPDKRYKNPETAPRVSPGTVKSELDLLSKLFEYAQKDLGIELPKGNPVKAIRMPSGNNPRTRRLTPDEHEALLKACANDPCPWVLPAVKLALATAMRQGELLGLTWEHVNIKQCSAHIPVTKNGRPRTVPLSRVARSVLSELPVTGDVLLPIQRMSLYKAFIRAATNAGITDLTFHDLRHEAISTFAELGLNELELAAISGHSILEMLQRYTHLDIAKLAARIDGLLDKAELKARKAGRRKPSLAGR